MATYVEYDATPGQSQKPVPYREPVVPYRPSFMDAHHVLGVAHHFPENAPKASQKANLKLKSLRYS
jgi:hypothetical protein